MRRCSEKAYARCPERHLCGPIEDAVFTDGSACAVYNAKVEGVIDQLHARPDMLRTGDPCPCCGQPIKTTDPVLLLLLTCIRDEMFPPSRPGMEDAYGSAISGD